MVVTATCFHSLEEHNDCIIVLADSGDVIFQWIQVVLWSHIRNSSQLPFSKMANENWKQFS